MTKEQAELIYYLRSKRHLPYNSIYRFACEIMTVKNGSYTRDIVNQTMDGHRLVKESARVLNLHTIQYVNYHEIDKYNFDL